MTEVVFEGGDGVNHCRGTQQVAQAAQVAGLVVHRLGAVIVRSGWFQGCTRYGLAARVPVGGMIVAMIMLGNRSTVVVVNAGRCLHRRDSNNGLFAPGIAQDHAATGKGAQRHACREDNQQDGFLPGTTHASMIGLERRHAQDRLTGST